MPVTVQELAPLAGVKLWSFAERAKKLRLASATADGAINVSPAWFIVKDETVYVPLDPVIGDPGQSTTADHKHLAAIEAGGRVSAVIDEGDAIDDVVAVQLEGKAEIVTDASLVEELLDLVAEKYFYVGHPHLEYYFSAGAVAKRQWARLVPERVGGWDLRELPQPPIADLLAFPEHLLGSD